MAGLRRYAVELVATFLLVLVVLGAAAQEVVLGALAVSAAVGAALWVGAHANPVLTLAAVVSRRLPVTELLPCWAAQFVGALLGAAIGRWLTVAPATGPLQDVDVVTVLVVETLFAFALAYVVLDRADVPTRWDGGSPTALTAALVVLAGAAVLDPVAGAAFNPATAFAQVVGGLTEWSTVWAYLLGCPAGAALAGLLAGQASSRPG